MLSTAIDNSSIGSSGVSVARLVLRGIFVVYLGLALAEVTPGLGNWLEQEMRPLFYWAVVSTLALPALLIIELLQRLLKRQKPLIDRGLWIDAALVVAWWLYLVIQVARTAARPIWAQ